MKSAAFEIYLLQFCRTGKFDGCVSFFGELSEVNLSTTNNLRVVSAKVSCTRQMVPFSLSSFLAKKCLPRVLPNQKLSTFCRTKNVQFSHGFYCCAKGVLCCCQLSAGMIFVYTQLRRQKVGRPPSSPNPRGLAPMTTHLTQIIFFF